MYLLDTNVLSSLMTSPPPDEVGRWVGRQRLETLWTCAVCQAEIMAGIAALPAGRRRAQLEAEAASVFAEDFAMRVMPFDSNAAVAYGQLFGRRRRAGRSTSVADLMIAAIAHASSSTIVTRDVGGFAFDGLPVISPWDLT